MANFPRVKPAGWAANEIYTATQANTLDIDHTKAPNFDDGSAHAPAADIEITGPNGLELQGNLRLKYASRQIVRSQPLIVGQLGGVGTEFYWASNRIYIGQATTGSSLSWSLTDIPDGAILDSVRMSMTGAAGHSNDPVTGGGTPIVMPVLTVVRQPLTGASATEVLISGSISNPTTGKAAYEAFHSWSVTGIAHTIDRTANRYFAVLEGESGAGFLANAFFYGLTTTCTMTEQPEY